MTGPMIWPGAFDYTPHGSKVHAIGTELEFTVIDLTRESLARPPEFEQSEKQQAPSPKPEKRGIAA